MGRLTEKETKIENGLFEASFLAEYNNGKLSKILCSIEVDGSPIKWHSSQEHGLHDLLNPRVFMLLECFLNPELFQQIKNQINTFKNAEIKN